MLLTTDGVAIVVCKCACRRTDALTNIAAVDCYVPQVACVCRPVEVVIDSVRAFPKAVVEQMACKSIRNAIQFFSDTTKRAEMPSWLGEMGKIATMTFTHLAEESTWYTTNTELIDKIGNPLGDALSEHTARQAHQPGGMTHGTTLRVKCADGDVLLTQAWVFASVSKGPCENANSSQGGQGN